MGNRGHDDGNYEQQVTGLIGECMVYHRLLKAYPDLNEKLDGFDGGVDIRYGGYTIDVKTMGRNCNALSYYANNFYATQKDYPCDILIFCSLNKKRKVLEICGWIFKKELESVSKLCRKGEPQFKDDGSSFILECDDYVILNRDLRPFTK